jgi:hypothetical protein
MQQHETSRQGKSAASVVVPPESIANGKARGETILGFPVTKDRWTIEEVKVTPAKASMILKAMPGQRPLNKANIARFKALICGGQFRLTHQGIAFNESGELRDGQHRLTACVETETEIPVQVTFNEPDENFVNYDRGWSRQIAHDLEIQGITVGRNASILQAAGRILYHFDAGRMPWTTDNANLGQFYTADVLHDVMNRHPLLLDTVQFICGRTSRPPKPPHGPLAAFGTLFREVDDGLACAFIDALITGEGLRDGDPALLVRTSLGHSGTRKQKHSRNVFMVRLVHAWNNVRSGKRVKSLMGAMPNGEFPKISGYRYTS